MERPLSSLVLVHEGGLAPALSAGGAGKLTVGPLLFAHPVTLDKVSVEKQRRLEPLPRDTFGAPISEPKRTVISCLTQGFCRLLSVPVIF